MKNKYLNTIIILYISLSMISCATEYKPRKDRGFGYSDVRLSRETFTIRFYGNEYTEEEWAQENCYRRAAELAVEQGFKYVIVLDAESKPTGKKNKNIVYTITVKFSQQKSESEKIVVDAEYYLYKYTKK